MKVLSVETIINWLTPQVSIVLGTLTVPVVIVPICCVCQDLPKILLVPVSVLSPVLPLSSANIIAEDSDGCVLDELVSLKLVPFA